MKENVPMAGSSSQQAAEWTPPQSRRFSLETPTYTKIQLISKSPISKPPLSCNARNKELDKHALSQVNFRVFTTKTLPDYWSIF
jgi:hypothetical protein